MFDHERRLSALEADVKQLIRDVAALDPVELARLRSTALNAIRSLNRKAGGDEVAPPPPVEAPGVTQRVPPEVARLDPMSQRIWLKRHPKLGGA